MTDAAGVGSIAEEAAKLVEAVQTWMRAARAGDESVAGPLGHLFGAGADASAECRRCPVCQLLALARGVKPETVEGLLEAGTALLTAARSMIERQEREWASRPAAPVEHITVT